MTPKEKTKELVNKYGSIVLGENIYGEPFTMAQENLQEAKQCALIAVDEILKNGSLINQSELYKANKIKPTPIYKEYWKQVKKEIKNL